MKTTFQIILSCALIIEASAAWANPSAEYCETGWLSKGIPGIGDGSLDVAAKVKAVAYCGSDKQPRYQSKSIIVSAFTSKGVYAKLESELLSKLAADNLVEVMTVGPANFSTATKIFTESSNSLKSGESLCYLGNTIKCTPGAKVTVELNEQYSDATMVRNGYSKVAPSLYRK